MLIGKAEVEQVCHNRSGPLRWMYSSDPQQGGRMKQWISMRVYSKLALQRIAEAPFMPKGMMLLNR